MAYWMGQCKSYVDRLTHLLFYEEHERLLNILNLQGLRNTLVLLPTIGPWDTVTFAVERDIQGSSLLWMVTQMKMKSVEAQCDQVAKWKDARLLKPSWAQTVGKIFHL